MLTLFALALKLHKQADMQEEKNRIERVLGAISQPELIQKVLTFALSVSYWKNLLFPYVMRICAFRALGDRALYSYNEGKEEQFQQLSLICILKSVEKTNKQTISWIFNIEMHRANVLYLLEQY